MCQTDCGLIGHQRFESPIALDVTNGMLIGSGLPIVSVRMPIMLWKCAVVRSPPLNHVEYGAPRRCVTPGLPLGEEALEHHRADDVDAGDRVGMLVVVERIPEGRREHDRALRVRSGGGCT